MALMMFFAGCQDPLSDYSVTNTNNDVLSEIAGPEWVKAEPLAGANRITWAFNKDAKGYAVYRQKVDAAGAELSVFAQVGSSVLSTEECEYIDAVSISNQLENGVLYKYGVVAYTEASLAGRAVASGFVKDGVTYADPVTANIPAQGTEVTALTTPALTAADITAAAVQNENGDELLVSWPSTHPAFSYAVKYNLGNATLAAGTSSFSHNVFGDAVKYFHTPLFSGTIQISLGVAFEDPYYYKPALITKEVTGLTLTEPLSLQSWFSFNVIHSSTLVGNATITWNTDSAAPNASDYKLYRIETKGVYQSSSAQIEVVGDWTAVTGIVSVTTGGSTTTITATDSGLEPTKNYLYALYAEVGGKKSAPVLKGLAAATVPVAGVAFDIETSYETVDDTRIYSAAIGWNAAEGVTGYNLERAITTTYPTQTTGAFTAITVPAPVGGRYTVIDSPAIWQSYVYRLTATVNGVAVVKEETLNTDPFSEAVSSSSPYSVAASTTTAYATEISFTTGLGYIKDITADIYRAVVPASTSLSNGFTAYAYEQAAFEEIATDLPVDDGDYLDTAGLIIGTKYIYRVEYKVGSKTLYYSDDSVRGYTGYVQTPSVPSLSFSSYAGTVGTTSMTNYFIVTGTAPLNAIVKIQTRDSGSSDAWVDYSLQGFVVRHPTTATAPITGTSVTPGSYYFSITRATSAASPDGKDLRFAVVNQPDNLTPKASSSYGGLGGSVTW
jgi:hypothetical protein